MKKVLLGVAIGAAAMYAYQRQQPVRAEAPAFMEAGESEPVSLSEQSPEPQFRCDGRQHCSEMGSCAEARYFLANCPDVKMDGDDDGWPCERGPC